jgi:hypothetical protein
MFKRRKYMNAESMANLINFLKQIGLIAIGALIPAISAYFVNNRREKSIVKINMQARAAEELLDNIKKYIEMIKKIKISLAYLLNKYNTTIKITHNLDIESDKYLYEINNLNEIIKSVEEYKFLFEEYIEKFTRLITTMEINEVIFNKMIGYRELLIEENKDVCKIYDNIINLYNIEIYENIVQNKIIDEQYILLLKKYEENFIEKEKDIYNYISDLKVAVQNEFFRKIFKYKVPYRNPQIGEVPVYRAGFKYEKSNKK